MKKKIELIKPFFSETYINQDESLNQSESERIDTLDQMNDSKENEEFRINNLYSIFLEIKNK